MATEVSPAGPLPAGGKTPAAGLGPSPAAGHQSLVLAALRDAAEYRREQGENCPGCGAQPCDDHAADAALARAYDRAYDELSEQAGLVTACP